MSKVVGVNVGCRNIKISSGLAIAIHYHWWHTFTDDAAADAGAFSCALSSFTSLSLCVFSLIVVIFSFIDDERASNNGERAAELNESISVLILSVSVVAALNLFDVTNTALHNVFVGVTTVRAEWIVDITN